MPVRPTVRGGGIARESGARTYFPHIWAWIWARFGGACSSRFFREVDHLWEPEEVEKLSLEAAELGLEDAFESPVVPETVTLEGSEGVEDLACSGRAALTFFGVQRDLG